MGLEKWRAPKNSTKICLSSLSIHLLSSHLSQLIRLGNTFSFKRNYKAQVSYSHWTILENVLLKMATSSTSYQDNQGKYYLPNIQLTCLQSAESSSIYDVIEGTNTIIGQYTNSKILKYINLTVYRLLDNKLHKMSSSTRQTKQTSPIIKILQCTLPIHKLRRL